MALPKAMAANRFAIAAAVACACLIFTFPVAMGSTGNAGAKQIYPTKQGGREWFFNATEPGGLAISPASAAFSSTGGAWQIGRETSIANSGLRMYVISPDGWRDVEMTGYVKLKSHTFEEEFAWAARSGQHTDRNPCDGTAYYGALSFAGHAWFQKEVAHVEGGYTAKRHSIASVEPLQDRWVGIKMVAYNVDGGVRLELWVDDRADNNWTRIAATTDAGDWSSKVGYCGKEPDHVISEQRPRVTFRIDNATFEFKNLSVREIALKCYSGAFQVCI